MVIGASVGSTVQVLDSRSSQSPACLCLRVFTETSLRRHRHWVKPLAIEEPGPGSQELMEEPAIFEDLPPKNVAGASMSVCLPPGHTHSGNLVHKGFYLGEDATCRMGSSSFRVCAVIFLLA